MQKKPVLTAEKRKIKGKKLKALRREGILPGNVYGKHQSSIPIQVKTKDFERIYDQVGETGLVDLEIDKDSKPVLVKNLQLAYPLRTPLHVDFYQVNLKEKVKSMVPVQIIGEPKAVSENLGTLITPVSEIEVEALPADLPDHIEVDVTNLSEVDAQILVSELKIPAGVTLLTEGEMIIAKIAELAKEEPIEEPAPEAESAETAQEEQAGENKEEKSQEEQKTTEEKSE